MLATLTVAQIRAASDPRSFARGMDYWRTGRVGKIDVGEDGRISGVVRGTERYHVSVRLARGAIQTECTCPISLGCKHAIALMLAYLESERGETLEASPLRLVPDATEPGAPREPTPGGGLRAAAPDAHARFVRPADVEAWAAAHGATHALAISGEAIAARLPADPWVRSGLSRASLRELACLEGARRLAGNRVGVAPLMAAACELLDAEAASVATALVEEQERAPEPATADVASLRARLAPLRAELRRAAMPRARAARAAATWTLDGSGTAVRWREGWRMFRTMPDWGSFPVQAVLTLVGDRPPEIECSCRAPGARCVHALALVDTTLDRIGALDGAALARELARPGWDRALRDLELLDAAAAAPRTAIEVWWTVEHVMGVVALTPLVKKRGKTGAWSAGARMSAERLLDDHGAQLPEGDERIARELAAFDGRPEGYPHRAFAAAVGHPRLLMDEERGERLAPIELAHAQLGFAALAAGDRLRLEPMIAGVRIPPRELDALLSAHPPGEPLFTTDPSARRLLLVEAGAEARAVWSAISRHGADFPPEAHERLLDRLGRLEQRVPIQVAQIVKGREVASELVTVVRLRLLSGLAREGAAAGAAGGSGGAVSLELELFVRPGEGAPLYAPGAGPTDVMLLVAGERGYVRRQLATEQARARELLARLPIETAEEGPPGCFTVRDADAALALVAALQTPPPGLEAEWIDARPTVSRSPAIDDVRVVVERRQDWFGIVGDVRHEAGRIELAVLLDAARRQQRYVRAGEHRWVELSDALRERLAPIADQTFARRDRVELSPGAVPAVRALELAGAQVDAAPAWQQMAARLATAARLRPQPPAELRATLRPYQIEGHAWLARVAAWGAGAVLADDMGLGKTVQAIAMLIDRSKRGPALVLAPTSVALNWAGELARFAPTLRPIVYAELAAGARETTLAKLKKRDVVIVSYGLLVRDAELLAKTRFATLVLDEAQAVKNPTTQRARAARALDAELRIAMSGTPLENHLGELWSLFAIVFPGLLGSQEQFRIRFQAPIERDKDVRAREALSRIIRPFLLRRTKAEVASELPPKTEVEVPIVLSPDERGLYEDARLAAIAQLGKVGAKDHEKRFDVLAALTRLRLLASHPRLYDSTSSVSSSKLRRLRELLEELRDEGHRALVFSQFTSHLAIVREELEAAGFTLQYLDGSTAPRERAKRIAAFQAGEGEAFLISLQAGGTGINLTAADYVIHLDPWWNPAVEDQATDRAHRIGQDKPVTVFRLVARGTIEERILALHGSKRALVGSILDGKDAAARLTTRDLLALLAGEAGHAG